MGAYVSLYILCVCVWSEMREQCGGLFNYFTEDTKSEGERDGGEMGLLRQSLARVGKDLILLEELKISCL